MEPIVRDFRLALRRLRMPASRASRVDPNVALRDL
jgi:hypothetical protein